MKNLIVSRQLTRREDGLYNIKYYIVCPLKWNLRIANEDRDLFINKCSFREESDIAMCIHCKAYTCSNPVLVEGLKSGTREYDLLFDSLEIETPCPAKRASKRKVVKVGSSKCIKCRHYIERDKEHLLCKYRGFTEVISIKGHIK